MGYCTKYKWFLGDYTTVTTYAKHNTKLSDVICSCSSSINKIINFLSARLLLSTKTLTHKISVLTLDDGGLSPTFFYVETIFR